MAATVAAYCPDRMLEHPISSQPNPGPRPPRSPCSFRGLCVAEMSGRWKENSSRPDGCGPLLLPPRHAHDAQLVCEGTEPRPDNEQSGHSSFGRRKRDRTFWIIIRTLLHCMSKGTILCIKPNLSHDEFEILQVRLHVGRNELRDSNGKKA